MKMKMFGMLWLEMGLLLAQLIQTIIIKKNLYSGGLLISLHTLFQSKMLISFQIFLTFSRRLKNSQKVKKWHWKKLLK